MEGFVLLEEGEEGEGGRMKSGGMDVAGGGHGEFSTARAVGSDAPRRGRAVCRRGLARSEVEKRKR